MALNRWSLERLWIWFGTASLVLLFVPLGLLLTQNVSASAEQSLSERGRSLVRVVAGQVVEPMLVDDRPALHDVLQKAASTDGQVRYLCVERPSGAVAAHTFVGGYPLGLPELWKSSPGQVANFRTNGDILIDIPFPILAGQLGTLHVGLSRSEAARAAERIMWPLKNWSPARSMRRPTAQPDPLWPYRARPCPGI